MEDRRVAAPRDERRVTTGTAASGEAGPWMLSHWTTLRYCDGYMLHAPTRGGRVELTLARDGHARVSNLPRPGGTPQVFAVQVAPWVLAAVTSGLTAAGFPALPQHSPPIGARLTLISLASPDRFTQVWVVPQHRRDAPTLDEAMQLLEGVAHAASHGILGAPSASERPLLA